MCSNPISASCVHNKNIEKEKADFNGTYRLTKRSTNDIRCSIINSYYNVYGNWGIYASLYL